MLEEIDIKADSSSNSDRLTISSKLWKVALMLNKMKPLWVYKHSISSNQGGMKRLLRPSKRFWVTGNWRQKIGENLDGSCT